MARYDQPQPGADGWTEEIFPIMDGYKMACCDCGLVHNLKLSVFEVLKYNNDGSFKAKKRRGKKWRVGMLVSRNNRATSAMRRSVE